MAASLLSRLGLPHDRAVVPHVDDLGASHGANRAFLDLHRRGLATCGSVMVPGPWFPEMAEAAGADPSLDLGVHLTLTSEWARCRWGPVSRAGASSGLVDGDGYFWRDVASLRRHMVAEAAVAELRAQVERAVTSGLAPTHLDAHMAAAMAPELLPAHLALAREFGLFPVLPRSIAWAPDGDAYRATVAALDAAGAPVVDHCRGTLAVDPAALAGGWAAVVAGLEPGVTHLTLHATAPGDFAAMAPDHAVWREAEYGWIAAGGLRAALEGAGVGVTSTRALQGAWLDSMAPQAVTPAQTGPVSGGSAAFPRSR